MPIQHEGVCPACKQSKPLTDMGVCDTCVVYTPVDVSSGSGSAGDGLQPAPVGGRHAGRCPGCRQQKPIQQDTGVCVDCVTYAHIDSCSASKPCMKADCLHAWCKSALSITVDVGNGGAGASSRPITVVPSRGEGTEETSFCGDATSRHWKDKNSTRPLRVVGGRASQHPPEFDEPSMMMGGGAHLPLSPLVAGWMSDSIVACGETHTNTSTST